MYWLCRTGCILLKHPTILNDNNTFVLESKKNARCQLMYNGTWCDSSKSIKWSIYMILFMFLWLKCYPVNGVPNVNVGNESIKAKKAQRKVVVWPSVPLSPLLYLYLYLHLTYIKIQITPVNIETEKTKVRLT